MALELDEEQKAERREVKKQAKAEQEKLNRAWAKVAGSAAGKVVLLDLLEQVGVYNEPFSISHRELTDYNCGKRSVGIFMIHRLMSVDDTLYPELLKEYIREANNDSQSK